MPRRKKEEKAVDVVQESWDVVLECDHPPIERVKTGLFSFDRAIGGGIVPRTAIEISGYEYSGKSTFGYFLLGCVDPTGITAIADFETLDPNYIVKAVKASGFHGKVKVVPIVDEKGKEIFSEKSLDLLTEYLLEYELTGAMVDSVGAIYPVSEDEGEVGESRVGRRAQIVAPFLRKAIDRLRRKEKPCVLVLTNHVHEVIAGRGTITSGGKAMVYYPNLRIRVHSDRDEDIWIMKGRIIKNRFLGITREDGFEVAIVPGEGVHRGLSAVQDCITYGLAKKDRTVTLNGTSYGFMSKLVENRNDPGLFQPFHDALQEVYGG